MHLRVPEGVRSTVDANLAIRGNFKAPTLGGTIVVKSATFTRRIDPTAGLFDFGSRSSSGGGGEGEIAASIPRCASTSSSSCPRRFGLRTTSPGWWRAPYFQLRGTYDHPQVFGRAEVDRGEVTFEGRRYLVTRGTIDFTNPNRVEPFFDARSGDQRAHARRDLPRDDPCDGNDREASADGRDLDPPLPAAEVLALLFGVGVSQNQASLGDVELKALQDPNQQSQDILATRATQLLTSPFSSQVGRVVEQTFGVDTFQLSPSFFDPYSQTTPTSVRRPPASNPSARRHDRQNASRTASTSRYSRSLSSAINDQIIFLEYDETDRFSWILSRNEDNSYALEFSLEAHVLMRAAIPWAGALVLFVWAATIAPRRRGRLSGQACGVGQGRDRGTGGDRSQAAAGRRNPSGRGSVHDGRPRDGVPAVCARPLRGCPGPRRHGRGRRLPAVRSGSRSSCRQDRLHGRPRGAWHRHGSAAPCRRRALRHVAASRPRARSGARHRRGPACGGLSSSDCHVPRPASAFTRSGHARLRYRTRRARAHRRHRRHRRARRVPHGGSGAARHFRGSALPQRGARHADCAGMSTIVDRAAISRPS